MADKVLCPWCGAEMEVKTVEHHGMDSFLYPEEGRKPLWNAWTSCTNDDCGAEGPIVAELESEQEACEAAKAAALRRYTPPLKPMTLEEVREKDNEELWVESRERGSGHMQGYCELSIFSSFNGYERFDFYPCGSDIAYDYKPRDYNREWRCWSRNPTDEERSEAEWL